MLWDELFSASVEYDPSAGEKPALPTGGGVYLLTDEQDRPIQLASSADLKRAILNRLAPPAAAAANEAMNQSEQAGEAPGSPESTPTDDVSAAAHQPQAESADEKSRAGGPPPSKRRADLSQIVRRIRWQPAHSAFEIAYEYLRIARVLLPDTYRKNLAFGPAWFVHVDPDAAIPRFTVGKTVPTGSGTTLGPFATQQDANRFVQVLEDTFDLCRYIHILEQAPHGQPCAYYEMGRCPAPCGGLIPMSQYRTTVAAALAFAAGDRHGPREQWEQQMQQAAAELAFEQAAAIRQRLERARELEHAAFRFVRPIEHFSWLIVQRGPGRTRVKPFFVQGGTLQAGEPVRLKQLEDAVPGWIAAAHQGPQAHPDSELIWLVSHFLCRREQTGLWLDAARLPEPAVLAGLIGEHFAARSKQSDQPAPN